MESNRKMRGTSSNVRPWSDLPKAIVARIAKCIDTETDFLRFRAVCSSWRTSTKTTPFERFPSLPLKLPFPFDAIKSARYKPNDSVHFSLSERTVYLVQLPDSEKHCSWVVKIEKSAEEGKLRLLNPVSDHQIKISPESPIPKVLDTLRFRVIEVCKAYNLQYINPQNPETNNWKKFAKKVVLLRGKKDGIDEYVVFATGVNDKLWHIRSGEEKWTGVVFGRYGNAYRFLDVVNYKGRVYGANPTGTTSVFDSMFNETEICGISYEPSEKLHLVDLDGGELFLVEELTDEDKRECTCSGVERCVCPTSHLKYTVEEIIISAVNKKDRRWEWMEEVKDWVIFAGDDCSFCISAKEFDGCRGTRIFYTDKYFSFKTEEKKKKGDVGYCDDFTDEEFDEGDGSDYDDGNGGSDNCCFSSDDDDDGKKTDNFVPSDDVKVKFRELHGHNTGVCEYGTGKIGSLLRYPEFGDVFWPPPSWIASSK